jgi:flavin reductase (DIM6/NTAB) family NADH-FMN oxidoreductase RutF
MNIPQVSHNPPLLSISFNLSPKKPKDTRENILATKEFVVNIVSEAFIEAANSASVEAPSDVNEWTWSGLTMEPSVSAVWLDWVYTYNLTQSIHKVRGSSC